MSPYLPDVWVADLPFLATIATSKRDFKSDLVVTGDRVSLPFPKPGGNGLGCFGKPLNRTPHTNPSAPQGDLATVDIAYGP
ncbi:MAG: hypothetical protein IIC50_11055 [Planctomycetes bacterium]|nr:hypothetical protein [Planctomycetota bacterium]